VHYEVQLDTVRSSDDRLSTSLIAEIYFILLRDLMAEVYDSAAFIDDLAWTGRGEHAFYSHIIARQIFRIVTNGQSAVCLSRANF